MNDFKATPEQWEKVESWASMPADSACILELRARVEQLETQANHIPDATKKVPPPVATDEELVQTWLQGATLTQGNRAIYNLGVAYGQARSREVADPAPVAGGFVERVTLAIDRAQFDEDEHQWDEARAAIIEVAKWMREQGLVIDADLLGQEAGR
jgi:hypothetical protein